MRNEGWKLNHLHTPLSTLRHHCMVWNLPGLPHCSWERLHEFELKLVTDNLSLYLCSSQLRSENTVVIASKFRSSENPSFYLHIALNSKVLEPR